MEVNYSLLIFHRSASRNLKKFLLVNFTKQRADPVVANYCVYMLRCKDGSLYTGITTDVGRRMREHLSGQAPGARYTRVHVPEELVALWRTEGRPAASRLEYRIKRLPAAEKRRLVENPHLVSQLEGLAGEDEYLPVL